MNPEYRPVVKIPDEVAAKSNEAFYVRLTLFDKIDLATDWLNIDLI